MSLKKELMKFGVGYALARLTSKVHLDELADLSMDDMRRWTHRGLQSLNPEGLLHLVGLQRRGSWLATTAMVVGGVTAGAAIGAGIGVLLAPQRGDKTRHDIVEWMRSSLKEVQAQANGARADKEHARPNA